MAKQTYFNLPYKLPKSFQGLDGTFEDLQLLHNKNESAKRKVMIVLDHVPKEDLRSGKILSGYTNDVLKKVSGLAKSIYGSSDNLATLDWLAINFNMFKTYGKDSDFQRAATELFTDRLHLAISKYKPDVVMTHGVESFKALNAKKLKLAKYKESHYLGTAIPTKLKYEGKVYKFKHVPCIPVSSLIAESNLQETSYLLGYMTRNMVTAFEGKSRYKIPKITKKGEPFLWEDGKKSYETVVVDTVKGVKSLMKRMAKAKYTSIDTEANNLNRIVNKLLTFQITDDPRKAYIIPMYHKDTPFTPKELRKISVILRDFFETKNDNIFQIYVNAKFDLNLMRHALGVRYYKADVWDIQAGEFALDENMKILPNVLPGQGYYNLANLTAQYGCEAYMESKFGKENRKSISTTDLDAPLLDYCSLDIVVPMYIFKYQLQRAKQIGYKDYRNIVGKQISDQIHTFSVLESTGARTDIEYLFKLKLPNSPISQALQDVETKLYESKNVLKANSLLSKSNNIPSKGLFGKVVAKVFNIGKSEHKQVLFFDVLGLKPIAEGKKVRPNGQREGGVGKEFQTAYKDVEEVQWFNEFTKIKKLRDAFVNSLIKHWGKDDDFKHDVRIRPQYSFLKVVTGRTSASDPNLQQIPSRSKLGKHIKRLFIAGKGKMLIKVDYSAHEVRCWSIISNDKEVANVFDVGTQFRNRFKAVPDPYIAKRIDLDGDVHKINAAYFFGLDIWNVTKPIRDSVKTVIFGLIYQQSLKNLAKQIGRELKDVEDIVSKFLKRFPNGVKWFDLAKNFATKNYYVQSPLGRRRNLWGLILPNSVPGVESVKAACLRRAVNSPVQGMGSDFMMIGIRNVDRLKFEHYLKTGYYPDMALTVSVHDSLTVEVAYEDFWLALDFIDRGLTSEVVTEVESRYEGFKILSHPEVDFEIGPNERDVEAWDFSYAHLDKIIKDSLKFQKKEMGYKVNTKKARKVIMEDQYDTMPKWMQKQVHSLDIDMASKGKDIRSKMERKQSLKWIKEIPENAEKLYTVECDIEKAKALEDKREPDFSKIALPPSLVDKTRKVGKKSKKKTKKKAAA